MGVRHSSHAKWLHVGNFKSLRPSIQYSLRKEMGTYFARRLLSILLISIKDVQSSTQPFLISNSKYSSSLILTIVSMILEAMSCCNSDKHPST